MPGQPELVPELDELVVPLEVDELVVPLEVDELVVPLEVDELVVPLEVDELVVPLEVDELVVPLEVDELVVPLEVDELVVPLEVDELLEELEALPELLPDEVLELEEPPEELEALLRDATAGPPRPLSASCSCVETWLITVWIVPPPTTTAMPIAAQSKAYSTALAPELFLQNIEAPPRPALEINQFLDKILLNLRKDEIEQVLTRYVQNG